MYTSKLITVVFFLTLPLLSLAQHTQILSELEHYLDGISQFGFSGNAIVANRSGILLNKAYGLADREDSLVYGSGTVVTVGSVTKVFMAVLTVNLEKDGLLSLDDKISEYLPFVPPDKQDISIRNLLTHTSGFKRNGLEGGDTNVNATREVVLNDVMQTELRFKPGTDSEYSNMDYVILTMILESVTDKNFELLLYEHIFQPARMFQTGFAIPHFTKFDLAKGYRGEKEIPSVKNFPQLQDGLSWNLRGAGGILSTPIDMYRFYVSLTNEEILSSKDLGRMIEKPFPYLYDDQYYAVGWEVEQEGELLDINHSGGNNYFLCDFHWLKNEGVMFFLTTNNGLLNITHISENVKKILRGHHLKLPPVLEEISQMEINGYAGSYQMETGERIEVTNHEDQLRFETHNEAAISLLYGDAAIANIEFLELLSQKSERIIEDQFQGNFQTKLDAMDGNNTIAALRRYFGYDSEIWDEQFGKFLNAEKIAIAGSEEYASILVKLNFERGAAVKEHTWRDGILQHIKVFADWKEFQFTKTFYNTGDGVFQSFNINSPISTTVVFKTNRDNTLFQIIGSNQIVKKMERSRQD